MRLYADQPSGTVASLKAARRDPTAEATPLRALRIGLPEYKWRFQAPVGPFRMDFMCFAERLVIEVDGATHSGTEACDASRTARIVGEGFRVLRFWNHDVMGNVDRVVATIAEALRTPSPVGRGKGEGDASSKASR